MTNSTAAAADAQKDALRESISQNMVASIATRVLYLGSRVFVPPITLMYVSLDEYGVWACCIVLISYLGMSAFGVSNVYIREVAGYAARGELERIDRLVSTGMTVVLAVGVALLVGLWFLLPFVVDLFRIAPELHRTAFVLFFGTVAVLVLDLSLGAFAYVLQGLQKMAEERVVWVISVLLETVLMIAFLMLGFGVYGLLYAFAIRYVVATILYARACYRALPGLSIRLSLFDREAVGLFWHYGGIVQLSGLLGIFLRSIERVLAGVFIGVSATALYDIGEKLPMMGSMVASAMNGAFLPATTHLHETSRRRELIALYLKGSRYMNMMIGTMMGFLAAFAAPIIAVWIGADERYAGAAAILAIFTYPYQINVLTGPGSAIFRGVREPVRELLYPIVQLALVAVLVGVGWSTVGPTIPMINVTVATAMVVSAVVYLVYTNRYLGVPEGEYWWKVHVPGLVPYAFGFALAALFAPWLHAGQSRWEGLAVLAVAGAVYALVVPAVLFRFFCDWGEREYLRGQARRTLSGVLPRRWTAAPAAR